MRLFRRAADQGHTGARFNLGCNLCNGWGVHVDRVEGFRLMQLAAESGLAEAQFSVGVFLTDSAIDTRSKLADSAQDTKSKLDSTETLVSGLRWIKRAAAQGHEPAVRYMSRSGRLQAANLVLAA